jgi:hypothetical protein
MFDFSFHTSMVKGSSLQIPKREIDKACDDKEHKRFLPNFKVDVIFEEGGKIVGHQADQKRGSTRPLDNEADQSVDQSLTVFKLCSGCGDAIFVTDICVSTTNSAFHWECVKCEKCRKSLGGTTFITF